MHLTLRQLQIFSRFAQSFTRAAEALHLTQPAVSMQMRQLEDQVDLPLFDRGKQIHLTDGPGALLPCPAHRGPDSGPG